jgi:hypothetical protein
MAFSQVENSYMDMIAEAYNPTMPPEPEPQDEPSLEGLQLAAGPSATRTDAPQGYGEARAVQPTKLESALKTAGVTLEQIGRFVDGIGQVDVPGLGPISLADLIPFVGSAKGDRSVMGTDWQGTPMMLQAPAEGKPIVTGTGQAMRLSDDAKLAAFDALPLAQGVRTGARLAVKGAKKAVTELGPTAGKMAEDYMRATGGVMDVVPPGPNVVSTRLPTAKKATEDPIQNKLIIDYNAAKSDPEAFTHNMGLIKQYPNFVSRSRNPERQAEDFIDQVKDNLLYLYDQVPDQTRQRSKQWYDGARNITDRFSGEYGLPDQSVAGVLAVLSPQKDWFMNVSLGQRVLDISRNQAGRRWDDAMENTASVIWADPKYKPVIDLVRGKTYSELQTPGERALWLRTFDQAFNPREHQIVSPEGDFMGVRLTQSGAPFKTGWGSLNEIGKAIAILDNPTLQNVSTMLGQQHKVRNFYNNIYAPGDPAGHVTIDTHAVAAGLLRPLSGNSREVLHNFGSGVLGEVGPKNSSVTGVQGTYGIFAEAYRRAAAERGVLPREMQSITWEAVRGLFPDTFKTAKNSEVVDNIWLQYRRGQLSLEEARNEVIRTAGGIQPPEWERAGLRPGSTEAGRATSNAGELSGVGVSRGDAGGSGRVQPAGTNQTGVTRGRRAPTKGAQ